MRKISGIGAVAAVLAVGGLGVAGWAAAQPATKVAAHSSASGEGRVGTNKGIVIGARPDCRPASVAAVAVVREGVTPATLARLTPRPLAIVSDSRSGELAFFRATSAPASTAVFSRAAETVRVDPELQSCDYMLRDRPAAEPFIRAAIDAAVDRDLAHSAGSLRRGLLVVEIGDNPLAPGSLVVALLLDGARTGTMAGHAVYGSYRSIFVVLDRAGMRVTGAAAGTW